MDPWDLRQRRIWTDYLRDGVTGNLRARQGANRPADRVRYMGEAMRYARLLRQFGERLK